MSSHRAFVSAAGLRRDGRRPRETRRLMYQFGALGDCDGSAYLEQGCNKVLVAVHGPRACEKRSAAQFDRATVTCGDRVDLPDILAVVRAARMVCRVHRDGCEGRTGGWR